MIPQWVVLIVIGVLVFTALSGMAFIAVYATVAPWRSTAVGRQVMFLCGSMTAVILMNLIGILFGDSLEFLMARTAGVALIGILLARQAWMVYATQKRGKGR